MGKLKEIINAYRIAKSVFSSTLNPSIAMTDLQRERFSSNLTVNTLLFGTGVSFQSNAYDLCPPLQAVINKKAQAITSGNIISVDESGNPVNNASFREAMKVIENPNEYQNQDEFLRSLEAFINVYGVAYVYKIKPIGFNKVTGMIVIPNNCINVTYNKPSDVLSNTAKLVLYYTINIFGKTYILRGDDTNLIYECRDVPINLTSGREFEPKSRVDSLRKPIENIVGSLESRNHIITKRGADIIMSPEKSNDSAGLAVVMDSNEVKRIQDDYSKYGQLKGQFHTLVSKVPLKAQKIGMNVSEMGLFDGENADHRAIAQQYNVPIPLLALPDTTKYSTYLEAKSEFYQDAIIPESRIISQMFNEIFEAKKNGYRFYFDFSNLECMQRSMKDKATTFSTMVSAIVEAKNNGLIDEATAKSTIKDYLI